MSPVTEPFLNEKPFLKTEKGSYSLFVAKLYVSYWWVYLLKVETIQLWWFAFFFFCQNKSVFVFCFVLFFQFWYRSLWIWSWQSDDSLYFTHNSGSKQCWCVIAQCTVMGSMLYSSINLTTFLQKGKKEKRLTFRFSRTLMFRVFFFLCLSSKCLPVCLDCTLSDAFILECTFDFVMVSTSTALHDNLA